MRGRRKFLCRCRMCFFLFITITEKKSVFSSRVVVLFACMKKDKIFLLFVDGSVFLLSLTSRAPIY